MGALRVRMFASDPPAADTALQKSWPVVRLPRTEGGIPIRCVPAAKLYVKDAGGVKLKSEYMFWPAGMLLTPIIYP